MIQAIISLDSNKIKEYIFSTKHLKEIRGASSLLDQLNRQETERLIKEIDSTAQKIYANGGSAMFLVDEVKADSCIQAVQHYYCTQTITGSISGTTHSYPPCAQFSDWIKTLNYKLRMVKDAHTSVITPVTHPLLRFCDSCGDEYAQYYSGENDTVICLSCHKKREKDKEIKKKIKQILDQKLILPVENRHDVWERLLPELMESPEYDAISKDRPEDFSTIGELSSPKGYMGLIYADGDSMGDKLERLNSIDKIKEFSETIDDAIFKAVLHAIQTHLKPKEGYFPFDILMLGGDDLVMVTTAEQAISTAITVMEKFKEFTEPLANKLFKEEGLSLSVGVVIAHAKFPIRHFLKLSENLIKSAKKKGKGKIHFQVISASNSMDFETEFKPRKVIENKKTIEYYPSLRPYHPYQLTQLTEKIQLLKSSNFPCNKLQAFRESAFLDYGNSMLNALTAYNRLSSELRQQIIQLLEIMKNPDDEMIIPMWIKTNTSYYTPFVDVAELYDFIPGR